jgi:hypothetical protein
VIRLFGSICGLIVFSSTILVGLVTGAEPGDLIPRAVQGMLCGVGLGLVAGWIGTHIIRDGTGPRDGVEEIDHDVEPQAAEEHHGDITVVGG